MKTDVPANFDGSVPNIINMPELRGARPANPTKKMILLFAVIKPYSKNIHGELHNPPSIFFYKFI